MVRKFPIAYVKTAIWFGKPKHYVGDVPSDPTRSHGHKLGRYCYWSDDLEAARAYARCVGERVVECDPYVGA